jgi:hypothetical protein
MAPLASAIPASPKLTHLYSLSLLIPQETDMLNQSLKGLHAV